MLAQIIVVSLLVISILIGLLLVVVWKKRKVDVKKDHDYQAFFAMGLSFFALGIALSIVVTPGFLGFFALGVIYIIIGLKNKDKWKKKE